MHAIGENRHQIPPASAHHTALVRGRPTNTVTSWAAERRDTSTRLLPRSGSRSARRNRIRRTTGHPPPERPVKRDRGRGLLPLHLGHPGGGGFSSSARIVGASRHNQHALEHENRHESHVAAPQSGEQIDPIPATRAPRDCSSSGALGGPLFGDSAPRTTQHGPWAATEVGESDVPQALALNRRALRRAARHPAASSAIGLDLDEAADEVSSPNRRPTPADPDERDGVPPLRQRRVDPGKDSRSGAIRSVTRSRHAASASHWQR